MEMVMMRQRAAMQTHVLTGNQRFISDKNKLNGIKLWEKLLLLRKTYGIEAKINMPSRCYSNSNMHISSSLADA